MRGRVMSVWFIITSGADSLGAFAIGALAQALGISQAIGLMAGLGLLGTLMCLVAYRTEK